MHTHTSSTDKTKHALIIFDLDGTLIDSVADLALAVNEMLKRLHLPSVSTEKVRTWVGNGSLKLAERALLFHKQSTDDTALQQAHQLFLQAYADCASKQTVAYAGVNDGLTKLKQAGYRLAIATNKPERFLPEILETMGWTHHFDCVLGGDSLATKKPSPDPLLHICTLLNVAPELAMMVGDSKNDILAGQAAKMRTLALRYGYNYDEPIDNSNPDAAFDDFYALLAYLLN